MVGQLKGKQSMSIRLLMLQAVYTALKETESRATDVLPLWKVPALAPLIPRQRKALQAVSLIRQTTEELIAKCKDMVDAEEQVTSLPVPCLQQSIDAVAAAAAIP